MSKKLLPLLLLILSVSSLHAQILPPPANLTYTNIDLPGAQATLPEAINARGQIAGVMEDLNGVFHGYRVDKDGSNLMLIDFPGSLTSSTGVTGINSRGDIVGSYTDTAFVSHGFLLRDGSFSTIDFPNAIFNSASGINDRGDIVGIYDSADGGVHGYLFDGNQFTTIDDPNAPVINGPNNTPITKTDINSINDHGVMAGISHDDSFTFFQSFLLSHGKFDYIAVPGFPGGTIIQHINDAGDAIGSFTDNLGIHGFLLRHGEFTAIDPPGAAFTSVTGINSSGEIVGFDLDNTGTFHFSAFMATSPATPTVVISTCPTVITQPGTYSLANDLFCSNTDGIDIQASNVTLLLNRHTITQDSADFGLVHVGISAGVGLPAGSTNVLIIGSATITGFAEGVNFEQVSNSLVEDVISTGNFFGFVVNGGFSAGCNQACPSTGNIFAGNTSTFNNQHGFTLNGGNNNTFNANNASNNGARGILLFVATGNNVTGNTLNNNGQSGIGITSGTGTGNNLNTNSAQGNGIFDLEDDNPNCDSNTWTQNTFGRANQTCIH
ncbi:MAG TPA: NosD domain-containing protein [Alphaproteobacteria bacterium]|nr:NosD domain-containing protein [Alphaproteobacteria bacterium]